MPWDDKRNGYRPGDFWRICDRSGKKVRASRTEREWTGLIVDRDEWEPRHPQDFVRGVRDDQRVPDARPEAPDTFLLPGEVDPNDPGQLLTLRETVESVQRVTVDGRFRSVV